MTAGQDTPPSSSPETKESLQDVLASIRALVSAEAAVRSGDGPPADVLHLTADMRVRDALSDDLADPADAAAQPAPVLDEESLRRMINAIIREELDGELGDKITRNLRKIVRRELAEVLDEIKADHTPPA